MSIASRPATRSAAPTSVTDTIFGLGGNDILHGHDKADIVYGNEGNDTVWGEDGVDELYGGDRSDKLRAQDNRTDAAVNCGAGADYPVEADPNDPVVSCTSSDSPSPIQRPGRAHRAPALR